jgi:hypothetical protein
MSFGLKVLLTRCVLASSLRGLKSLNLRKNGLLVLRETPKIGTPLFYLLTAGPIFGVHLNIAWNTIKMINKSCNEWMERLELAGIFSRPATHTLHMLTYYKNKYGSKPEYFPNAFEANDCGISLHLYHGMAEDRDYNVISQFLGSSI